MNVEEMNSKRADHPNARYANDPEYREKKLARAKAWNASEKGEAYYKAYQKSWRSSEEGKAYQKAYRKTLTGTEQGKEKLAAYHKARNASPEAKAKERARQKARYATEEYKIKKAAYRRARYANDPKMKVKNAAYSKARIAKDPLFALASRVRSRTAIAFKAKGYKKGSKTATLLGCPWEMLFTHIEKQFTDGMSWENRHLWHIDHIIPLASATTEAEIIALCHFTNLRPLWAKENLRKQDKLPHQHQPELPLSH